MINKKYILCILLVVSLLCLFSCKEKEEEVPPREYVESEVIENATILLQKAKDVNRIVWGVGILPIEGDEQNGTYRECSLEEMERYGVFSVDDIRTLCKEVYSGAMCQTVEHTAFGNVRDENESIISLVRYYDKTDKESGKTSLMVNTGAYVYFEKEVDYHTETLQVKGVKGEVLTLTVNVTLYDEENQSHDKTLTFSMIEETDGWKLHSPSYMKYDAYSDIYDNLTKN